MLSTCPEACPRGRVSGCCSCGSPRVYVIVARRDTPVPALSRGPDCVPRPSRVAWRFCLAPVPFVSASARWFTCACSRFFFAIVVCVSAGPISRVGPVCVPHPSRVGFARRHISFPALPGCAPAALARAFDSLSRWGVRARARPRPPRARVREISGAREHADCPCAPCVPRTLSLS